MLDPAALTNALRELMVPLAALAVAQGMSFGAIESLMKSAFVDAARAAHPNLPPHRLVSRISTATGINRREVSRIAEAHGEKTERHRSPANRVFSKWITDPALRARGGAMVALPRVGPAPSFESLAHSVTRDVHPRSLLDELCRLGLACVDDDDMVRVVRDSFVPHADSARMLGFAGMNVGDHLRAAAANILSAEPIHLEQAISADELSTASVATFQDMMRSHWKSLVAASVPMLQRLIDDDEAADRPRNQRVRVGMYAYHESASPPNPTLKDPAPPADPAPSKKRANASKRRTPP